MHSFIQSINHSLFVTQDAIKAAPEGQRPKVLVSASAVGFYGNSQTASFVEDSPSGAPGLCVWGLCTVPVQSQSLFTAALLSQGRGTALLLLLARQGPALC